MNFANTLKQNGCRVTQARLQVLEALDSRPLTVQDISFELKGKNIQVDTASIYRSLKLFEKIGLVSEVELGEGKKRYELRNEDHHHHHLICNNCGTVKDISVPCEKVISQVISHQTQFQIEKHTMEFFGLCQKCC